MDLRGTFPSNAIQNHPQTNVESHVNGNKKSSSNTMSMYNGAGPDNCGSEPTVEIKLRSTHGFYSRLPSLGRSSSNSQTLNSMNDCKQHKDPSESKINSLFDHYKVLTNVYFVQIIFIKFLS